MRCRVDLNQAKIVSFLKSIGASVQPLTNVGEGCPDLLIGFRGQNHLLEIKQKIGGKLTPAQKTWHQIWEGKAQVVYSVEDIIIYLEL